MHTATAATLDLLQRFLRDTTDAGSRLAVVTSGAVATSPDEDVPDLAAAAVWGLVRTAQTENPDRFVLVDLDGQRRRRGARRRARRRGAADRRSATAALSRPAWPAPRPAPP